MRYEIFCNIQRKDARDVDLFFSVEFFASLICPFQSERKRKKINSARSSAEKNRSIAMNIDD